MWHYLLAMESVAVPTAALTAAGTILATLFSVIGFFIRGTLSTVKRKLASHGETLQSLKTDVALLQAGKVDKSACGVQEQGITKALTEIKELVGRMDERQAAFRTEVDRRLTVIEEHLLKGTP